MDKYGMKELVNNFIPFKGCNAMTILKWIFVRKNKVLKQSTYTHEVIHSIQQKETLLLGFLLFYVIEYIIKLPICDFNHDRAYRSISFEQEAYHFMGFKDYPYERDSYYWIKYVFSVVDK